MAISITSMHPSTESAALRCTCGLPCNLALVRDFHRTSVQECGSQSLKKTVQIGVANPAVGMAADGVPAALAPHVGLFQGEIGREAELHEHSGRAVLLLQLIGGLSFLMMFMSRP